MASERITAKALVFWEAKLIARCVVFSKGKPSLAHSPIPYTEQGALAIERRSFCIAKQAADWRCRAVCYTDAAAVGSRAAGLTRRRPCMCGPRLRSCDHGQGLVLLQRPAQKDALPGEQCWC